MRAGTETKNNKSMKTNKILSVFKTYCDAYLCYMNDFITMQGFIEYFNFSEKEVETMFNARQKIGKDETWRCLDYYVNIEKSKN